MSIKYHVRKRLFLNRDKYMSAYIIGIVEDTSEYSNDENGWKNGTIELKLSDCYRNISFDFSMNDADDRADALYKIRRIEEVVSAVMEAIEKEVESINRRRSQKCKKPKTKAAAG
ncbi:MAG TPA: hypothetical protein VGC76_07295 [Pyrinomonadaceae bacterium]|jgi:hypothetical protein